MIIPAGSRTTTAVPCPGALRASKVPPLRSMMAQAGIQVQHQADVLARDPPQEGLSICQQPVEVHAPGSRRLVPEQGQEAPHQVGALQPGGPDRLQQVPGGIRLVHLELAQFRLGVDEVKQVPAVVGQSRGQRPAEPVEVFPDPAFGFPLAEGEDSAGEALWTGPGRVQSTPPRPWRSHSPG